MFIQPLNNSINLDSRTTAEFVSPSHPGSSSFGGQEGGGQEIIEGIWRSAFFTSNENKHFHTWLKRPRQCFCMQIPKHNLGSLLEKGGFIKHDFLLEVFSSMQLTLVTYAAVNLLFSCFTAFSSCFCQVQCICNTLKTGQW